MAGRVRVFVACSLDGFIAGPEDDLEWLSPPASTEDTFTPFFARVGAMLMGRRTFDVLAGFEEIWPYGDTPILVATHRPLTPHQSSVRAVRGSIEEMIAAARKEAGARDIYVDGGALIRAALDADLVDRLTITIVPVALGAGIPLFAGCAHRHDFELIRSRPIGGGLVQLEYQNAPPARGGASREV